MTTRNIKDVITALMIKDTGVAMCDSGGCCGRHYQQNGLIESFADQPAADVSVYGTGTDGEVLVMFNIYHYLTAYLEINEASEKLNAALAAICYRDMDDSYWDNIGTFLCETIPDDHKGYDPVNTYNYDNILSQVLQYRIFEYDYEDYIVLELHNGADVRGGYTPPQVFRLPAADYFMMAQCDLYASCDCTQWQSDDGGYHWFQDAWDTPQPEWIMDQANNKVTCPECGSEVVFSVMETY